MLNLIPMSLTLAEPLDWQTAKVFWGGDETYHWYYQTGRITHEVITVAQVDVHGRTNNAWIESKGKRLRLPGQGGMADVANLHKNFVLYLTRHSPERFVDAVSFCTASRGLLTDEARLAGWASAGKSAADFKSWNFRIGLREPAISARQHSPGNNCWKRFVGRRAVNSWSPIHCRSPQLRPTEQLRLIRREIDPFGIRRLEFVPSKSRLAMIESILDAEETMLEEVFQNAQ